VSQADHDLYEQIKELRERFIYMSRRVLADEELFILARLGKNEDTKTRINDLIMIITQLKVFINNSESDPIAMRKVQNLLRNVQIVDPMINILLKGLYFDSAIHRHLFQEVLDFMYMYVKDNPVSQQTLIPHMAYLLSLVNRELNSCKVIA